MLKAPQCLLLIVIAVLPATAARAQDAQDQAPVLQGVAPEAAQEDAQEREQEREQESEQDESNEESGGRFIPSEEISQDFGVSFPVDI